MALDSIEASAVDAVTRDLIERVAPTTAWPEQFKAAAARWRERVIANPANHFDMEIQRARIGDATVVAAGGELFSKFTADVREQSDRPELFTVGYANAGFGYIPTQDAYAEGGYEVDRAHIFYGTFRAAPDSLELLATHATALVLGERL
jgi:hypothetical protein